MMCARFLAAARAAAVAAGLAWVGVAPAVAGGPPVPVVRTLSNGLRVAVFPDSQLPVVQMQMLIRMGSRQDPAGKEGMANLLSLMLDQGTAPHAGRAFAAALDQAGMTFSSAVARDYITLGCSGLSREFEEGLRLLGEAARSPAYADAALLRQRVQLLQAIADSRLNPSVSADAHAWAMLFAPHPYGRAVTGTAESVTSITLEELNEHQAAWFRPDLTTLAIAGDVVPERAFHAAEEVFRGWVASGAPPEAPATIPAADTVRVRVVDAPNLSRTYLRLAYPGSPQGGDDDFAALVMNSLLASGALGAAAGRDSAALPLDARSTIVQMRDAGLFTVSATCLPGETGRVVSALRSALARFRSTSPKPADLLRAKRRLEEVWPLSLETRGNWTGLWLAADFYGGPADCLQRYPSRLRSVTAAQVQQVARRWLDPSGVVIVALGPAVALRPQLEATGVAETVDALADPMAASRVLGEADATPQQIDAARKAVQRAILALGGAEAVAKVKSSEQSGRIVIVGAGDDIVGRVYQARKDPYRLRMQLDFQAFGNVSTIQGLDGWAGWIRRADSLATADSITVRGMRNGFVSEPVHLLRLARAPATRVALIGRQDFFGQPADALSVWDPVSGHRFRYYLDAQSGVLLGTDQEEMTIAGKGTLTRRFREYRAVDGVQVPFYEQQYINGALALTYTYNNVKLNSAISDSLFMRPVLEHR